MKRIMFKIARNRYMGKIVGFLFAFMSPLLPLRKILNNKNIISFFHPVPSYEQHILIIPKKILGNILDISDMKIFEDIINSAIYLSNEINWKNDYIILCVNGGNRQDVKQVHFHMFSTKSMISENFNKNSIIRKVENKTSNDIILREYNSKKVIEVINKKTQINDCYSNHLCVDMIYILKLLNSEFDLSSKGYTLMIEIKKNEMQKINGIFIDF